MAASVNRVCLVGVTGKDAETKTFNNGGKIVSFSLATSESWKDRASGERKEQTQWHRIVVKDTRLAEVAERYVRKGTRVWVSGSIEYRKYTDRDGVERMITEIALLPFRGELTLLSPPRDREETPAEGMATRTDARGNPQYSGGDLDQEIPF